MTVVVGCHLGWQFGYLGHLLVVQVGYFASAVIIPAGRPRTRRPITY